MITEEELLADFPILSTGIGDNSEKIQQAREKGRPIPGELTDLDIMNELGQKSARLYPPVRLGGYHKTRKQGNKNIKSRRNRL